MAIIRARQTGPVGGVVRQAGAVAGPGPSPVPGAIGALGATIDDAVLQAQAKAQRDARQAMMHDANAALIRWENDRLHGPEGYFKQKGRNAIEAFPQVETDYADQVKSIAASIKDEETRARFQRQAELRKLDATRMAGNHFARESDAYQQGQFNAILSAEQARAAMNAADSVATLNSLARQNEAIADYAEREGLSDEQRMQLEDAASQQTYALVFDQLLANEQYEEAERRLSSKVTRERMGPELATQVEARVRDGVSLRTAQDFADETFRRFQSEGRIGVDDMVEAIGLAREQFSGPQEQRVIQQIREVFGDAQRADAAALDEERTATINAVLGAGVATAAQRVVNAADPRLRATLQNLVESRYLRGREAGRTNTKMTPQEYATAQKQATNIRDAIDLGVITDRAQVYDRAQLLPATMQDELADYFDKPAQSRLTPQNLAAALNIVSEKQYKPTDRRVSALYEAVSQRLGGQEPTIDNLKPIVAMLTATGTVIEEGAAFDSGETDSVTGLEAARLGARGQATFLPRVTDELLEDIGLTGRDELIQRMAGDGILLEQYPDDDERERAMSVYVREQLGGFPAFGVSFAAERQQRAQFVEQQIGQVDQVLAAQGQSAMRQARADLGDNRVAEIMANYSSEMDDTIQGAQGMRIDLDNAARQGVTPDWLLEAIDVYGMSEQYSRGLEAQSTPQEVTAYILSNGLLLINRVTDNPALQGL